MTDCPLISPYHVYRDAEASIDFLARAFGFEDVLREGDRRGEILDPEGRMWSLSRHVRGVPPGEWGGTVG